MNLLFFSACPWADYPKLEEHIGQANQGDVCRRKVTTAERACPKGCRKVSSAPWCKAGGTNSEPCRANGTFLRHYPQPNLMQFTRRI